MILLLISCGCVFPVGALPYAADHVYLQSAAVEKHYEAPAIVYATPNFSTGRDHFTSHEEMMAFLQGLQRQSNRMQIKIIGYSEEQRPIPLLIFSKPSYREPADVLHLNKPVIWLQGQQHGNEPASGEAMLVMAHKLALEDWGRDVLEKVTVLIVPRCNPDGAYYFDRRTARRMDANRDHIKLELPETRALHSAFSAYHPDLAIDNHEYCPLDDFKENGAQGKLRYHDMLLLAATNANIPRGITELADGPYLMSAQQALAAQKLTYHWYYTVSDHGNNKQLDMGDSSAIIGRNAHGLQPALSFLVESRGIGLGQQDFLRRVTGHVVVDTAMILTAAQNPMLLKQTVAQSRERMVAAGKKPSPRDRLVIIAQGKKNKEYPLPVVDAVTGEVSTLTMTMVDEKELEPVLTRERPTAYLLPPVYHQVARILAQSGVAVRALNEEADIAVETYRVTEKKVSTTYFDGHFRNAVKTAVSIKEMTFPAGSYVFTMDQPLAGIIALTLEPEADSSLVRFNILPVEVGKVVPVYRYRGSGQLNTRAVDLLHKH